VYLIPFKAPKPENFKLYKQKTIGLQGSVVAKTNGLYFFLYQQEAILSYDDYKKGNIHKTFAGYYRFKKNGEMHIAEGIFSNNPDSIYFYKKESINLDIDKSLYGYYSATERNIKMEYVRDIREKLVSVFYESTGVLSKNGDTLFVKEHRVLKNGKIETLNRTCIYYSFQK